VADDATKTEKRIEVDSAGEPDGKKATEESDENYDAKTAFHGDNECPECGEPVEDVRMTCPNCGHEYTSEEYTNEDAGKEFRAGSALDESGEEKEGVTGDAEVDEGDESESAGAAEDSDEDDDTSSDTSDDTSSDE